VKPRPAASPEMERPAPNEGTLSTDGKPDKRILAAIAVLHAAAAALTWRDLRTRAAWQVRGGKRAWRTVSALNTLGAAAYWLFGRRQGTAPPTGTVNTRRCR